MNSSKLRVAISTGQGRLHLMQSADWLARRGVNVSVITGWMPKRANNWIVCCASWLVGRNLVSGFEKRLEGCASCHIYSCAWTEFLDHAMRLVCRRVLHCSVKWVATWSWWIFGLQSRRFINGIDVLHVRSGAGRGGAIESARRKGIKVLVDHSIAHSKYMGEHLREDYRRNRQEFTLGLESPFWRLVLSDCERADLILVNSTFVKETFVDAGFPAEKIRVVYLGVRPDFFGLRKRQARNTNDKLRLLFTGGFNFRKGAEYILETLRILKTRIGDGFTMDVYGDISESHDLIVRYSQFDLPCTYHGQVPQDDLKRCLADSDIYLFPSLAEGCASSGMEAMAAGLCVVTTKESGLPVEAGCTGRVVPCKNVEAIVDEIVELYNNRSEIDRLGCAAAALIAKNYTWQKYAENVELIYRELMGGVV